MKKNPKNESASDFICDFCKKEFKREKSFLTHTCTKKKRFQSKDEKGVRMGFMVYQKFYQANYKQAKTKTFLEFIDGKNYAAFVKFGEYLNDLNAVRPMDFITFLMRMRLTMEQWGRADVYEMYLTELMKSETYDAALERTFAIMQEWAADRGENWRDFFRKVETPIAVLWIMRGRISPWAIYLSSSGADLLSRMNEEQMRMIQSRLDPIVWQAIFLKHDDDVGHIREILEQENI